MPQRKLLLVLAAVLLGGAIAAIAQDDSPSLGNVARQARQQKQTKAADNSTSKDSQNKDAQSKATTADAAPQTAKRVITNDEIPSHVGPTATYHPTSQLPTTRSWARPNYNHEEGSGKLPAQQWTNAIQSQKTAIASFQAEIDQISASIQYAGGNCVSGCVQWNEHQKQKQDQVESMKQQLEQARQQLEQMQEAARQQGYGSSVYDP